MYNLSMSNIKSVQAREILDSRGNPTVEVVVQLSDGSFGKASVPSGASTSDSEALELRDEDPERFNGKGVTKAINNVSEIIAPAIKGLSSINQNQIDETLISLDGTHNKSRLGANSILGVSLANAHAAASSKKLSLYEYLNEDSNYSLPVPLFNIINGGAHAEDSTDFQEFMLVPIGFEKFSDALRAGVETYHSLMELLRNQALGTHVGDEGGFAPRLITNRQAIELVVDAIEAAGYKPGEDCFIAMDIAASELTLENGRYSLRREELTYSADMMIDLYQKWTNDYPIISIEDGISENDWEKWSSMTKRLGNQVQLVGDDLYATNPSLIQKGINENSSNAVLIKLNQIGTLSETLQAIKMTQEANWNPVISHRSGETEDTSIADLSVTTAAGQIKSGAPARGERTAKYNRLLANEQELNGKAEFAGPKVYDIIKNSNL